MASHLILIVFGILLAFTGSHVVNGVAVSSRQVQEKEILETILDPRNYDSRLRPSGVNGTGSVIVSVNFYIRSIEKIDDVKMEYRMQLTFREQWLDPRLKYSNPQNKIPYMTLIKHDQIWTPDLFFSNEKEANFHNLMAPNSYVRVFPDGEVLFSTRVSLTLSCPMILKLYPFDRQTCSLRMASYGYTSDDIIFKWKKNDPVQVTPDIYLPHFALEQFTTDYCDSHTNTGIYSCLRVDILFKREFSYYLLTVYIPTIMFVILAYLSFWIHPRRALTARTLLSLLTLLVMTCQVTYLNSNVAFTQVSYTRAFDVWTGMTLTFVFYSVLQLVIVHFLDILNESCRGSSGCRGGGGGDRVLLHNNLIENEKMGHGDGVGLQDRQRWSTYVDWVARIAYPILFIVFNICYWSAYTMKRDESIE